MRGRRGQKGRKGRGKVTGVSDATSKNISEGKESGGWFGAGGMIQTG